MQTFNPNLLFALAIASLLSLGRIAASAEHLNLPVERLSSGALLRLDRDGDMVETPPQWKARLESAAPLMDAQPILETIGNLDVRVGSNIRLGDDPPQLPQNFRAQAEPHIARAPNDTDFLIATFQEGRFTNGGAVDCGYSVSHDGGLTWTRALIPNLTPPSGGTYQRATDPVVGVDFNGNAYLNTLGLRDATDSEGDPIRAGTVLVSRSTDGGNTFTPPFVAYEGPNNDVFADKNWMAVNSFPNTPSAGRLLVTFTLFSNLNNNANSPIMRVFSDDGGATWSSAAPIHATNFPVQGSQPVFLPDGRAAIIYWNFNGTDSFADDFMQLVVAQDGGATFGAPKLITAVSIYDQPLVRDAVFLPSATTDRTTNNLYVVYQATRNGVARILFTKSTNAGDTWSTPIPITDNPAGSGVFNAAISASPDGQTLTAAFYDARNNPGSTTLVDMYLAQSFDGGATWQPNIRVTSQSTNAALAVNTGSAQNPNYMLGDYLGIAPTTQPNVPAVLVWVDTRTGNPDPFVARVGIAPEVNLASWQAAHFSLGQLNNPAVTGEAADPDGDGEDNRTEFTYLTDPTNPASAPRTASQLNISTRAFVQPGDNTTLIGGFIINGNTTKRVIVRAIGPSLGAVGVTGPLADPTLELVPQSGPSTFNDNWQDTDAANIQATGLAPTHSAEAAIVQTLAPGAYTAIVRGQGSLQGVALVEVYDLDNGGATQLRNLSSRGFVGVDENVMIGGFIVGAGEGVNGNGSVRALVRGIGPTLTAQGVANALQDPELLLFNANGDIIAANNDWDQTQQAEIQATGLAPQDSREAAILHALPKGNYTTIFRGVSGTTGVGLVEVYDVD